jgi:uncharacterized CHY-type Zn-finger protein
LLRAGETSKFGLFRKDHCRIILRNSTTTTTTTTAIAARLPDETMASIEVHGLSVTALTQCEHWHSARDIIAIRHACCLKFYACISCHNALEQHKPAVWPLSRRNERAVLCGQCKHELRIDEYIQSGSSCTNCAAEFNPGCKGHWEMYFELESTDDDGAKTG